MALFKISKGSKNNLGASGNSTYYAKEGFAYFTTEDSKMYIDIAGNGTNTVAVLGTNRLALNAARADIATTVDDGAITNAKIANGTITNAKLVANSIGIAGTSLALGSSISKNDLRTNLGLNNIYYGICDTAANVTAKTVACTDFTLDIGATIFVKFTNANTGAVGSLTMSVNNTTAKPIKHWYNGSVSNLPGAGYLGANQVYMFYYDGTNWITITNYNTNDDSKVKQDYNTSNTNYPLLMSATGGITSTSGRGSTTSVLTNTIYANPSTGTIYATTFNGALSGNATSATGFAAAKTIALTGHVTGSATGGNGNNGWSISTTIGNNVITNGMIKDGEIQTGKLASNSIKIADNSIVLGGSLSADTLRTSLGLSNAMHFIGVTTTNISSSTNTATIVIDGSNITAKNGDVVLYNNQEWVWGNSKWNLLGDESSYKIKQTAKDSPTTDGSTNAFIDTIQQNANGEITATKKTVQTASTTQAGIIQIGTGATNAAAGNHNHNSTYLKLDGSNNMSADVNIITGDTDKFVNFWYDTNKKAGASWRIGALGSGTADANYFVIQSGTSTTSATTWNSVFRVGQNTYDIQVMGNLYPSVTNTKTLGTSNLKWANVYATTFTGNLTGNASTATTADKLTGFSSRASTMTWGNQTGSVITCFASSGGGGWGFRDNNPASGQLSMTIDGTIYIKEGVQDISAAIKSLSISNATVSYTNLWGGTGTAFTIPTTAGTSTLAWNTEVTLGTVAGLAIKAKLPANPNTNTDTLVKQTAKTDNVEYKLLATTSASPSSGTAMEAVYDTNVSVNPSTHTVTASTYKVTSNASITYNSTTGCLEITV